MTAVVPRKKPEKHGSQRNLETYLSTKKMGFPGMIASVPCVTGKVTLKMVKKIINILRKRGEHAR